MTDNAGAAWKQLAQKHHDAAASHAAAAHHHQEAAFALSTRDGASARRHALTAAEHGAQAAQLEQGSTSELDDYNLDVQFETMQSNDLHPMITSKSLCTPGCGHTGTGNSFCCV